MAVSYRTLSGCCVSLVMGFSYSFLRQPEPATNSAITATPKVKRARFRTIFLYSRCGANLAPQLKSNSACSNPDGGCLRGDFPHLPYRGLRIGTVKDRRSCDDPITPRPHDFGQIFQMNPAVDLDRKG